MWTKMKVPTHFRKKERKKKSIILFLRPLFLSSNIIPLAISFALFSLPRNNLWTFALGVRKLPTSHHANKRKAITHTTHYCTEESQPWLSHAFLSLPFFGGTQSPSKHKTSKKINEQCCTGKQNTHFRLF